MCDLLLIWFLKRLILNLTKCHLVPNNHACASTQRITRRICNCRTLHFFIRKYQSFLSIHRAYHQPLKNHKQHISESCQKGREHRAIAQEAHLSFLKNESLISKAMSACELLIFVLQSEELCTLWKKSSIFRYNTEHLQSLFNPYFLSKYFLPSTMGIFIFNLHCYTQVLPKEKENYLWMSRLSKMAAELSSYSAY